MKHEMRLKDSPFKKIANGTKTYELRVNDEKRRALSVGDTIEFTNLATAEKLTVQIIDLHVFNNFAELYSGLDKIKMGYDMDEEANPKDMEQYYPNEEQEKYGVVAIEIKLI